MRSQLAANSARRGDFESSVTKSFQQLFPVLASTRALHFVRQENFFVEIENKNYFFLVVFTTDF